MMTEQPEVLFRRITDVLDKDPKALALLNNTNKVARKCGFTPEQHDKAHEMVLLAAILQNKEAFDILSNHTYNYIREKEGAQ